MAMSPDLMIEALDVEATFQALRAELAATAAKRDRVLYAAWREENDARAVARDLPRTITTRTVQAAVIRLAPPSDFVQLSLMELAGAN
ncbi:MULTISPECIES: hypothetical protein [Streptacidiphilus]|uniref:Uncharacterized protein n=1 Tax=Streptacidiphilus cavernicola TaxID=3342716 RepID=A0ABV6UWH0_9ACTN|nr:hypothetical protein [Streptacidiphilus jeojiense]